jgi:hypothetical protein
MILLFQSWITGRIKLIFLMPIDIILSKTNLRKLTSILRIACKEVDDDSFRRLGIKDLNLYSLKTILTKPKGQGIFSKKS